MIAQGRAYMDNTDQETMQAERMARSDSKCRSNSVEANTHLFESLLRGDPEAQTYCLRQSH
jgi:glutamyl/glutaminyl-tRNA synthetase